jgi:hypothetical protein
MPTLSRRSLEAEAAVHPAADKRMHIALLLALSGSVFLASGVLAFVTFLRIA